MFLCAWLCLLTASLLEVDLYCLILWKDSCFCSKCGTKVLLASVFPILVLHSLLQIIDQFCTVGWNLHLQNLLFISWYFVSCYSTGLCHSSPCFLIHIFPKTCGRSHFSCAYFRIWRFIFLRFFKLISQSVLIFFWLLFFFSLCQFFVFSRRIRKKVLNIHFYQKILK